MASAGIFRKHLRRKRPAARPACGACPALLAGCSREEEKVEPEIRPVRALKVERRDAGVPVSLTGRIAAEDEVSLAFRISGRMIKMDVNVGDRLTPGQVVAQLDSVNEQNALRTAQANLTAAQGQLTQARNHFERQDTLLKQGWTTRVNHDQAVQALQTAESQVEAAEAQLKTAQDLVGFTELKADAPGVVTAIGPRAGEVVQVGQMIARVARKDGRDAVFDVPAQLIRAAPSDPLITVSLSDDPKVVAQGPRARSRAAGQSGDAHLRGQGRPDQSAGGDAARRHRDRPHGIVGGVGVRDSGQRADPLEPAALGLDRRSEEEHGLAAPCRCGALRPEPGVGRLRARERRRHRDRRRPGAASGSTGAPARNAESNP